MKEYMCQRVLHKKCHGFWINRISNEKDSCVHAIMHEHSSECDENCVCYDGKSPCVKPFDDDFIAQEEMVI
jgi:hypothetical protein